MACIRLRSYLQLHSFILVRQVCWRAALAALIAAAGALLYTGRCSCKTLEEHMVDNRNVIVNGGVAISFSIWRFWMDANRI